jgi:serine/threonine protein kinase
MTLNPSGPPKQWQKSDFKILKKLGTGNFGVVYKAIERSQNTVVALKVIKMDHLIKNEHTLQTKRELEIQHRLR